MRSALGNRLRIPVLLQTRAGRSGIAAASLARAILVKRIKLVVDNRRAISLGVLTLLVAPVVVLIVEYRVVQPWSKDVEARSHSTQTGDPVQARLEKVLSENKEVARQLEDL